MHKALLATLLLATSPSLGIAQSMPQTTGQSITQPAPNMANPQERQSASQQPPEAHNNGIGQGVGQQYTQPIPNQNQTQDQINNAQGQRVLQSR